MKNLNFVTHDIKDFMLHFIILGPPLPEDFVYLEFLNTKFFSLFISLYQNQKGLLQMVQSVWKIDGMRGNLFFFLFFFKCFSQAAKSSCFPLHYFCVIVTSSNLLAAFDFAVLFGFYHDLIDS